MTRPRRSVVLVGIDGGRASPAVLSSAARLAEAVGSELVVAHVVAPPAIAPDAYVAVEPMDVTDVELALFPDVTVTLCPYAVSWRLATVTGDPATQLAALAEDLDAAAVVVGADTPGWAAHVRRFRCGSVPQRLAHIQGRPVLVIPNQPAEEPVRSGSE